MDLGGYQFLISNIWPYVSHPVNRSMFDSTMWHKVEGPAEIHHIEHCVYLIVLEMLKFWDLKDK